MNLISSAVTLSASLCIDVFNKKANANLSSILLTVSKTTLKSLLFSVCSTLTSSGEPTITAPFLALVRSRLFTDAFGLTKNTNLDEAAAALTIDSIKPSSDFRSPRYSST